MEHFNSLLDLRIKDPTAITIGKFDGIHKGHHLLTSDLISKKSEGLNTCIITFKNSPRFSLTKDETPSLFTNKEKEYILEQIGINYLISCPFDKKFMQIEATKFIEILCKNLNMKYLVVGTDFTFGYKKSGNVELLKKISGDYGFELKIIDKLKKDDREISSSYIREELMKGNLDIVNEMLGYEYFIFGEVINIGEFPRNKFGNPIIIIPPKNKLIPKFGYYITSIIYDKKKFNAITHIGENLFNWNNGKSENNVIIDSYIFGYDHDLYGKNITINFEKLIGDKINFDTIEEFKEQIK